MGVTGQMTNGAATWTVASHGYCDIVNVSEEFGGLGMTRDG